MDFFQRQDTARRNTAWLVVLFAIAVAAIILVVYVVIVAILVYFTSATSAGHGRPFGGDAFFDPQLFAYVAGSTLIVVIGASLFKSLALRSGGESVALLLGGRLIDPRTTKLKQRRLLNVIEEMAIASGTAVPPVYLLNKERGINAFAAGFEPGDAVIGVTRGTLDYLDRDELQGVMAHEFSHITNGDTRLNLRLVGWTHGILVIAMVGYFTLRSVRHMRVRSSNKKGGGNAVILILAVGAALMAIGYIGVFFAKLIKAAVSRQREYLADASAVQFTRNPDGIASALKKIGGLGRGTRIEDSHAEEVSHMFFGDAMKGRWFNLFSTHPPLDERIHRIDPSFENEFAKAEPSAEPTRAEIEAGSTAVVAGLVEGAAKPPIPARTPAKRPSAASGAKRPSAERFPLDRKRVLSAVGALSKDDLARAATLLTSIPEPLKEAAHDTYGARAVIYALLLDDEPAVREAQFVRLEARAEALSYRETQQLEPLVDDLSDALRLPLIELTLPALRSLSDAQYDRFRANVDALILADEKVDLSEYIVRMLVIGHLDLSFRRRQPAKVRYRSMVAVADAGVCLLSVLARTGHRDEQDARKAFLAGIEELKLRRSMLSREMSTMQALDKAIRRLRKSSPAVKRKLLAACGACVAADGRTTVREVELLRAVADTLQCPMAPLFTDSFVESPAPP